MVPRNDHQGMQPLTALASATFLDRFIAAARQMVAAHVSTYPDRHDDIYHVSNHPYLDVLATIAGPDAWELNLVGILEHRPDRPVADLCIIGTVQRLVWQQPMVAVAPGLYLWAAPDTGYSAEAVIQALDAIAFVMQSR